MTEQQSSTAQQSSIKDPKTAIGLLIIVLIAGGLYLITGTDPLGLFNPDPTATPELISDSGDWWEVHFTAPQQHHTGNDNDIQDTVAEKLVAHINQAQASIHIAAFEFNLTPVAEALIAAKQRGVEILWITDDEHGLEADEDEGHGQFALLEQAGIGLKDDARSALMHNKFWIFDQQTVWTGSTNVTVNGVFRNNNNVIVLRSPRVAAMYEREFAEMWAGQFGPRSPSTLGEQQTSVNGTPIQIMFAAEDEVVQQLVPLIEAAQRSIRFMAFSFTHDDLGTAILGRAQAGVKVQGIFETRGSETPFSELPRLYCANVPVRQDGNSRTFHHKVFIIDDHLVLTGSLNFSENADDSNDENVLLIQDEAIAAIYLREFETRWQEARQPDLENLVCP